MSDSYAGNPANYPANITRPVGTDVANAASVRTPLTELADRTAHLAAHVDTNDAALLAHDVAMTSHAAKSATQAVWSTSGTASYPISSETFACEEGDIIEAFFGPFRCVHTYGYAGYLELTVGGFTRTFLCNQAVGAESAYAWFSTTIFYEVPATGNVTIAATMRSSAEGQSFQVVICDQAAFNWLSYKRSRPK